jgi:hypothetical protein
MILRLFKSFNRSLRDLRSTAALRSAPFNPPLSSSPATRGRSRGGGLNDLSVLNGALALATVPSKAKDLRDHDQKGEQLSRRSP